MPDMVAGVTIRIPSTSEWFRQRRDDDGVNPTLIDAVNIVRDHMQDRIYEMPTGRGRWRGDQLFVVTDPDSGLLVARYRLMERPWVQTNTIQREDMSP